MSHATTKTLSKQLIKAVRAHCYDALRQFHKRHLKGVTYWQFCRAMRGEQISVNTATQIERKCSAVIKSSIGLSHDQIEDAIDSLRGAGNEIGRTVNRLEGLL
jgi:hypothetical protein